MAARLADHFLAMLGVKFDRDRVAHRPGGDKQRRLFAEKARRVSSSRLTVGSSPYTSSPTSASAMARRMAGVGLRDGVTSQVDHAARNSWKTSFDSSTPRGVNRSRSASASSSPASIKRSIGVAVTVPFDRTEPDTLR